MVITFVDEIMEDELSHFTQVFFNFHILMRRREFFIFHDLRLMLRVLIRDDMNMSL
jgi:hypothetical protein